MKGVENLIECRKRGLVPTMVVVHLAGDEWPRYDAEWYLRAGVDEDLSRVDLRCLVGLRVTVHGPANRADAVKAASAAVMKAKPLCVMGYATDRPKLDSDFLVYADGDFSWLN